MARYLFTDSASQTSPSARCSSLAMLRLRRSLPHPSPPPSLSLLNSERVYWGVTSDPRAI